MTSYRDVILIVLAVVLVAAVLLPIGGTKKDNDEAGDGTGSSAGKTDEDPLNASALQEDLSAPATGVPHPFFPVVKGSEWKYLVTGPKDIIPDPLFVMRLAEVPTAGSPGRMDVGYGKGSESRSIMLLADGGLQFDGLPFIAPRMFLGNRPVGYNGEFLPPAEKLVEGAVWTFNYVRELSWRTRDAKQNIIDEQARGMQTDRAMAGVTEKIIVPVGIFNNALRVEWLGRIDIEAGKGRKVLQELTVEPFRRDTMWFVPGIGMVKRRVTYDSGLKEDITFDLVSYRRPS